jgi:hypothetical protein
MNSELVVCFGQCFRFDANKNGLNSRHKPETAMKYAVGVCCMRADAEDDGMNDEANRPRCFVNIK